MAGSAAVVSVADLWRLLVDTQADAPPALVVATALVAVALVGWRPSWRRLRGVVTIAHEGGHATVAVLSGYQSVRIRVQRDTSGSVSFSGRSHGRGQVHTLLAGYLAPSVLGLFGAALLWAGRATVLLLISVGLLVAMLPRLRNVYGVVSVVGTAAALVALMWFASPPTEAVFGHLLVWFLLFAAPRPVWELSRQRRHGRETDSDADQLASITGVGAGWWVALFGVLTVAAAVFGAFWLLPWAQLPLT